MIKNNEPSIYLKSSKNINETRKLKKHNHEQNTKSKNIEWSVKANKEKPRLKDAKLSKLLSKLLNKCENNNEIETLLEV